MIILIILIVAIFAGIFLSGMLAPVIIVANRKQLKAMREAVAYYEDHLKEDNMDTQFEYSATIKTLYSLKKKIWIGDKKSVAEAEDIISEFTARN